VKYVLALVTVSYALQCLSLAVLRGSAHVDHLRKRADKIEFEYQQPGLDSIRRTVEILWFVLYLFITYRLLNA